jgi:hypothetical protein
MDPPIFSYLLWYHLSRLLQIRKKDDITSNGSAGVKDNREMATWRDVRNTEESDESTVVI